MAVIKKAKRAPSAQIANQRLRAKRQRLAASQQAAKIEARARKNGGYGRAVVSIHAAPKGGIKSSPAYMAVLKRCGGTMPPPEQRLGAAIKGGYPLKKYPINLVVDGVREYWVPDDWAQVLKNTGPGGYYVGWMSPGGKFFYHRKGYPSAIEETLGRPLTVLDGFNGIVKKVEKQMGPNADKKFLDSCLTPSEKKQVISKDKFHFGIVSARRATGDAAADCMTVEAHFKIAGIRPTWYVDAESLADYKKLGFDAKVGGKLTPARNMILDDAKKMGKVAVEISDDILKWDYFDVEKQNLRGEKDFTKANKALLGAKRLHFTPVAGAQYLLAKMRSSPLKPRLGGVYPTANAAMVMGQAEVSTEHFILGDFFVADNSPCRFDEQMTLKEDYDFTCQHIDTHGSVYRCNRMFVHARHATNAGGAVDARDKQGKKERYNIAILQQKWPGAFRLNGRRKDEVILQWKSLQKLSSASPNPGKKASTAVKKSPTAAKSVRKTIVKKAGFAKRSVFGNFSPNGKLTYTKSLCQTPYINIRCQRAHGKTIKDFLGSQYRDAAGKEKRYGLSDLRYDINAGRLKVGR